MAKIVVIDPDKEFYKEIQWALSEQYQFEAAGYADRFEVVSLVLNEVKPSLVIVGPGWTKNKLMKLKGCITDRQQFNLLLISEKVTSELIQMAIEIKATDILSLPLQKKQLIKALERAQHLFEARIQAKDKPEPRAEVITIFGPKGGVGKSVIATNMAAILAGHEDKRTIILDADLQFGDIGVMLKLEQNKNIYQAISDPKLTFERIKEYLISHSSGLKVLLPPIEPEISDLVKPGDIERIIKYLKRLADYIIIDTPPTISDNVLTILDHTDSLLLVVTMDVPSLKNARLTLETLEMLKLDMEKIKVVVNRLQDDNGVSIEELEKALKVKVVYQIPEDKEVLKSVNEGQPIITYNPNSDAAKKLADLTDSLYKEITISQLNIGKSRRTA